MTNTLPRLSVAVLLVLATLGGCADAPKPDHRIKLMPSADGKHTVVVPPECLSWHDVRLSPEENHPWPQYGCANARNLAAQVDRPEDLMNPKDLGYGDPVYTSATIQNYRSSRTKPLIDARQESPTAAPATGAGATPNP